MIDLELSPSDQLVVDEARRQGAFYRRHAPAFDHVLDHTRPTEELFHMPGAADLPHVRDMARDLAQRADDASGTLIMDCLITLEENWGLKPYYQIASTADFPEFFLPQKLIMATGSEEQIFRWADMSMSMAFAMTEPAGGSDPATMRTSAQWDEATEEWVLNGEKTFISWATGSPRLVVLARAFGQGLDGAVTPFVVDRGHRGVTVSAQMEKLGLKHWDTASVFFDDCRLPDERRLRGSLRNALEVFNEARGLNGAQALGYARAALDITRDELAAAGITIDYGLTLAEQPAIVDRFIRLEEQYEAAWLTLMHAMWQKERGGPDQYPAIAKFACAGAVRRIVRECIDLLGPEATTDQTLLERLMRDSRVCDILGGAGNVLRIFVARWLLGYKKNELN